jgi:phospholipase/lecithinase/hemolysin
VFFITEAHKDANAILEYIKVMKKASDSQENAFFVDTRPSLRNDRFFLDEMHPTYDGHKIIAQVLFDALLSSGAVDMEGLVHD